MDEAAARRVLLVRAFESTPGAPWSEADRDWADSTALRRSKSDSDAPALIAERARIAFERLQSRDPSLGRWFAATAAPAALTLVLPLLGAVLGLASDAIGASRRIDLLAPPLLALMTWNLVVYVLLAWHALRGAPSEPGPLRCALHAFARQLAARWLQGRPQRARSAFIADWSQLGRPLHEARIARALHLAAAAFAIGALASMYARGLAFEYRAGWDSTFLDAAGVQRLLGIVLWPARLLAGFDLPDAAALEALRFSRGPGENAARWIHAYAASVLALVVLPRFALAGFAQWRARQFAQRFPIALDGTHFEALAQRLAAARPRSRTLDANGPRASPNGPDAAARSIELSLVSHTNVGKTTLARTLLRMDIGEVRDAEHVTFAAEGHTLVESDAGDRLELWDTPGFGDSVRLAERLAQSATPVGWFLGQVWDRVRDRAFWSSQRALRNVFERADVVLYLVDASPADASTPNAFAVVDAELRVLDLLRKPVLVLLNRLGAPRPAAEQDAQAAAWRERLASHACVRGVLALDAFTRCWVQEGALLDAVAPLVPADLRPAFARLRAAWQARSSKVFERSMQVLARRLARAALDRETVVDGDLRGRLLDIGAGLGLRPRGQHTPREKAMQRLADRLAGEVRASTDVLIELHELGGHSTEQVLAGLAKQVALTEPLDEGRAALWGGIASGALVGLKADLASGGLTLGGGMLAGGIVGALGAAGLARGYNQLRGVDVPTLIWSPPALETQVRAALLGYLAVAHFGRGRGVWSAPDEPAFWAETIDATLASRIETLRALLAQRDGSDGDATRLTNDLQAWLLPAAGELLRRLYPTAQLPV